LSFLFSVFFYFLLFFFLFVGLFSFLFFWSIFYYGSFFSLYFFYFCLFVFFFFSVIFIFFPFSSFFYLIFPTVPIHFSESSRSSQTVNLRTSQTSQLTISDVCQTDDLKSSESRETSIYGTPCSTTSTSNATNIGDCSGLGNIFNFG